MKNNKWLKLIGKILVFASIGYILCTLWENRKSLVIAFNGKCFFLILLLSLGVMGSIILYSFLYRALLSAISGKEIESSQTVPPYVQANLYKYLPGNIMHYIGRNKIAADGVVSYEQVNTASVIEALINIAASCACGLLFAANYMVDYLVKYIQIKLVVTLCLAGCLVCLLIAVFFRQKVLSLAKPLFNHRTLRIALITFAAYFLWNTVGNYIVVQILRTLGGHILAESVLPIIGISTISWLIGFLTPGAPGGIGIREAMLDLLLVGVVPSWMIATAGVLTRMAQILGEVAAFILINIIYRKCGEAGDI